MIDAVLTKRRDRTAALKLLKSLISRNGTPREIVTDRLRSHGAALKDLGLPDRHVTDQYANNRAENSYQPLRRRERGMQRFRQVSTAQKFSFVHGQIYNHFSTQLHLI